MSLVRKVFTVREVAVMLKVSRATVYGLVERGELECIWVVTSIRVPADSLDAYLSKGRRSPSSSG